MLRLGCRSIFTLCALAPVLPGCLALSFGGKSQQVETVVTESPQTLDRIGHLEARIDAMEQHLVKTSGNVDAQHVNFSPYVPPPKK